MGKGAGRGRTRERARESVCSMQQPDKKSMVACPFWLLACRRFEN